MFPPAYRALLADRSIGYALGVSLVGRLSGPAAALAVVLILVDRTGSYAYGGLASALWVVGAGVGGLLTSRLVDRGRPRLVLLGTAAVSTAGLVTLGLLRTSSAPVLLGVVGAAALAVPPVVPTARALWAALLPDPERRSTMFALEATAQELMFLVGPSITGLSVALISPGAGAIAAALLSAVGTFAFARVPGLRLLAGHGAAGRGRVDLGALAVPMLVGGTLVCGLGATEVATVAAADAAGRSALAGLLLAVWSCGSLVGGLLAGARPARRGNQRRLLWLLAVLSGVTALLAAAPALFPLGVGLVLAGFFVAPAMGALYAEVERRAPAGAVARTFAVLSTAGMGGGAAGAAASGALAEEHSAAAGFLFGAGVLALSTLAIGGWVLAMRARDRAPGAAAGRADAAGDPASPPRTPSS